MQEELSTPDDLIVGQRSEARYSLEAVKVNSEFEARSFNSDMRGKFRRNRG